MLTSWTHLKCSDYYASEIYELIIQADRMKLHHLLLIPVLFGTMPVTTFSEVQSQNELFPVFGISLGVIPT